MRIAIRLFTLALALIALGTGAKSVWGGLPAGADALVDNTFRFYAGVWFAAGLGLLHTVVAFDRSERVFAFLMRALIVGGIARAIGVLDDGLQRPIAVAIVIEIALPIALLAMRARLARRPRPLSPRNGRSVLVTGANGGLGRNTVEALVADGFSRIVMACRTEGKAKAARAQIGATLGPATAPLLAPAGGFDMSDPAAIRKAVAALPADQPFDVVFLQAGGVVFGDAFQTVEFAGKSIERTVFQNVVGAHVVLSALASRGLLKPGARVVYAGGEGARGIPKLIDKPSFDSAAALRHYIEGDFGDTPYNPMNAIGVSKLVGALWTTKLAQRLGGAAELLWFSPGLTGGTQGLAGAPAVRRFFLEKIGFPLMGALGLSQSPRDGARKYADCLLGKVGQHGDVIGAPEGTALGPLTDQTPMNPAFSDPALQAEVLAIFEELDGPFGAASTRPAA